MRVQDMRGLLTVGAPTARPDMVGIQNPLSGVPASLTGGFGHAGYPNSGDPILVATNPSSIANLVAWFKASDFDNIADGTEVIDWYDHSSQCRNAIALGGVGNRQTVSRNALNGNMTAVGGTAKRGLGTNLGASGLAFTSILTYTLFGVISFSSLNAASENNWFGITNNGLPIRIGINNTGPGDLNLVYPNVGNFRTTTALTVSTWHYIILENSADTETYYLDGSTLSWSAQPGTPSGNRPDNLGLLDDGNSGPFRGLCAEMGIYDRALTSGERTTLYTYFQHRYNLP